MNEIELCARCRQGNDHCQLSPTCKGWGCRFLATPIQELPTTDKERAVLFSQVYREAKRKGVLNCPYFNSLQIDRFINTLDKIQKKYSYADSKRQRFNFNIPVIAK